MDFECSFTEEPDNEEFAIEGDTGVVRLEIPSEPVLHNSQEPVTPVRLARGRNTLRSYLTTSSAKKRKKKAFHCYIDANLLWIGLKNEITKFDSKLFLK